MDETRDKVAITDLLIRCANALDSRDWPTFRLVFAADCELDFGSFGRWRGAEDVTKSMKAAHERMGPTLHRITNVAVEVDGDRATAHSYIDAVLMNSDRGGGLNAIGLYDDHLVRTPDGWRISERTFTLVTMHPLLNKAARREASDGS